ncbi:MAG TPA: murein transglycosylase [Nocardioides sp.]
MSGPTRKPPAKKTPAKKTPAKRAPAKRTGRRPTAAQLRKKRERRRQRVRRLAVPSAVVALGLALLGTAWWLERDSEPPPAPQPGASAPGGFVPPASDPSPVVPAGRPVVPVVDPAWTAQIAEATGIPPVAVNAYAVAELRLRSESPSCSMGWSTLAGIGYVESRHGTIHDSILGLDGHARPPIVGPALDGSGGFAAIPSDPLLEEWHGDPEWDHAVGPMQFISSTWDRWRSDGDGDGEMDPNDLDDAAYAAARYLCHDGHDLTTGQGWADAVFSYNHDDAYVASVYAAASDYATRSGG